MSQSVINSPSKDSGAQSTQTSASEPTTTSRPRGSIRHLLSLTLGSTGPTLVLIGFAAVFYYGHHNDWHIPKFASLTGSHETVVDDWCEEHAVPESVCVECDPTLMAKGVDHGWCADHGVHNCPLHHPDVAQLKVLPNPSELVADFQRAQQALAVIPRQENNSGCEIYKTRIQFESIEAIQQAGVDVELIGRKPIVESIISNGEIVYDATRLVSLSSRVPGTMWNVSKKVGDHIKKGEVIAVVDAVEVGELKTNLLRSLAEEKLQRQNVSRLTEARNAIAGSRILDAEAALAKARADMLSAEQSLRNLGLPMQVDQLRDLPPQQVLDYLRLLGVPESIRVQIEPQNATANLLPIFSPMDGIVVQRSVTSGEVVNPSRVLFQVADTQQMWLQLSVPLEYMDQLAVGQRILFTPDGSRRVLEGQLDWINTSVDNETRMLEVRAVLGNADGRIRDETFGSGKIILREESDAIVIPTVSSHWEGCCQVVFVRDKNYFDSPESYKVFHVRSVRLGAVNGDVTEVISGVLPGEVIVSAGSDVLRAQLLKNNLGAGCDCVAE